MTETTAVATVESKSKGVGYSGVTMQERGGGAMLMPKSFGDVVAFATVMARSDVALPKHLRGNDGACLAVTMQAIRWEMDPFAVANKTYSVNDRLAYEAQLVAAVIHTRAPIKRRPDYTYSGEGPTRKCKVEIEMLDGTTKEYESPTFAQIPTKNSPLWKSDPDQQLGYYAIRSWGRRHTPEVLLGVYTPEELADVRDNVRDITPAKSGVMARLEANATGGAGFTKTIVEEGLGLHLPIAPDIIDAVIDEAEHQQEESHATDVHKDEADPETPAETEGAEGAVLEGTDVRGDQFREEHVQGGNEADPLDWAASQNRLIEAAKTVADLDAMTDAPGAGDLFGALQAVSPGIATALQSAAKGKRKALVSMERGQ